MKTIHEKSVPDRRFAESQLRRATKKLHQSRNMQIKPDVSANIVLALVVTSLRELAEHSGIDISSPEFLEHASNISSAAYAIMRIEHENGTHEVKGQPKP